MIPLVIFHSSCPDGWGAAWWLGKALGEHDKHEGRYGDAPPDCTGRDVYVVDFCYETCHLEAIVGQCKTLTILDHHQTALGWLEEARGITLFGNVHHLCDMGELGGDKAMAVLQQDRSGVGLVGEYVRRWTGQLAPRFLLNIEDRDLWRFALDTTREVFAAVTSRPFTVEAWDEMAAMPHEALVAEGAAIERYRQQLIGGIVATAHVGVVLGRDAWVAPSPYAVGSDVAGVLAERDPYGFAGYFAGYGDRVRWGLRSMQGTGMDVAALAQTVGGGGHRHAAGFEVTR